MMITIRCIIGDCNYNGEQLIRTEATLKDDSNIVKTTQQIDTKKVRAGPYVYLIQKWYIW